MKNIRGQAMMAGLDDRRRNAAELACIVQDPNASPEAKNQAMQALHGTITEIARGAVSTSGAPRTMHDELLAMAPTIVWRRLKKEKYSPDRGAFESWCRRVTRSKTSQQQLAFGSGDPRTAN